MPAAKITPAQQRILDELQRGGILTYKANPATRTLNMIWVLRRADGTTATMNAATCWALHDTGRIRPAAGRRPHFVAA